MNDIKNAFNKGLLFLICKKIGKWPSLETMNSFLENGVDDTVDESSVTCKPLKLQAWENEDLLIEQGFSLFDIDSLGVKKGDWINWFAKAVHIVQ